LKLGTTRLLICAGLWLLASTTHIAIAQNSAEEERLFKAAFIYNFAKFTRWPEHIWNGQDSLTLCTAGKDELASDLKRLSGKMIKGHLVSIQPLKTVQTPEHCNLLYIAKSEKKRYADILKSVRNKPVLSISELPHFGRSGGIIELYREKGRTRLIINLGVARKSGLEISSRLLMLAKVIDKEAS